MNLLTLRTTIIRESHNADRGGRAIVAIMTTMSTIRTMIPAEIWCLLGFFILCAPTLGFVLGDLLADGRSMIARTKKGQNEKEEIEDLILLRHQQQAQEQQQQQQQQQQRESVEDSRSSKIIAICKNDTTSSHETDEDDEEIGCSSYNSETAAENGRLTRQAANDMSSSSFSTGWKCAIWCSILVLLYAFLRLCMRFFHLYHHAKDTFQNANDLFELILRGMVLYYCGNLDNNETHCYYFCQGQQRPRRQVTKLLLFFYSLFWYSFTYEVCPNSFQFSSQFQGSTLILLIVGVGCTLLFYVLGCNFCYHLRLLMAPATTTISRRAAVVLDHEEDGNSLEMRRRRREGILWFMGLIAMLLFHLVLFLHYGSRVHMHHHWNGWLLAMFCRHPNKESSISAQALGCAFFLHGIAFFGVSPLYDS